MPRESREFLDVAPLCKYHMNDIIRSQPRKYADLTNGIHSVKKGLKSSVPSPEVADLGNIFILRHADHVCSVDHGEFVPIGRSLSVLDFSQDALTLC